MAEKTFHLQIISPTRVFFNEAVDMVEMKTTEGEIGVLAGHIPGAGCAADQDGRKCPGGSAS